MLEQLQGPIAEPSSVSGGSGPTITEPWGLSKGSDGAKWTHEPASRAFTSVIPADTVYAALGDPTRRRLLQILAHCHGLTATALAGNVSKRLDATLKHLTNLRGAGLVSPS